MSRPEPAHVAKTAVAAPAPVEPAPPAPPDDAPRPPVWIGVQLAPDSTDVAQVIDGSPAAKAGIVAGDHIVSVDGTHYDRPAAVVRRLGSHAPGEEAVVVIERGGSQREIRVRLEPRPEADEVQRQQLVGKQVADLELAMLDGSHVKLSSLRGKVIVLDFWATWCGPCRASLPHLVDWHTRLAARGLVIVGVSDEEEPLVREFAKANKMTYALALDPTHQAWRRMLVSGIPTTVIVDKQGVVRRVAIGLGDVASAETDLDALLK